MLRRLVAPYREGVSAMDARAFAVVAATFLFISGRISVLTFIGLFLEGDRGIALSVVGVAILVENLVRGLVSPFSGALSDRIGRPPVILGSALLAAALMPGFLLVRDVAGLFAWSVLVGVAQGPFFSAATALLADLVPPGRRQSALAVNYTSLSLGYTLSVGVAGFLVARSYAFVAALSSACFLLVVPLMLLAFRGARRVAVAPRRERSFLGDLAIAPRDPAFVGFALVAFVFPFSIGAFALALPIFAVESGLDTVSTGLVLSLNGVLLLLLSIPVNARIEASGPFRWLPVAAAVVAAAYFALASLPLLAALLVGVVLLTLAEAVFSAALPAGVAALAPPGVQGAYQGAWGLVFATAVGSALYLASVGRDHVGWRATWAILGAAALAAGALLLVSRGRLRARSEAA